MEKKIGLLCFLCLLPVGIYADCIGKPNKNFPKLPDSFQTVIEANVRNKDYSILEREYYDGDKKMTVISQLRDNKKSRVIIDEKNKQALHINESINSCTVTPLADTKPGDYPFGGDNKANGQFLYSTRKVFDYIKGDVVLVRDAEEIRGIMTKHWCTQFTYNKKNFDMHMYFTDSTWSTAGGYKNKPVRFVLSENSTSPDALELNYEYYTFYPRIRDDPMKVFEPPAGVICKGQKSVKKIPQLPKYFSYRQEVVYDDSVKISDVWYDEKNRLLRIDYRPGGIEKAMSAALSEIHDYNTGVLYTKNVYLGNCSVSTLSNSSFGTERNATSWKKDKSYEVMLKNPLQYFYLDSNYQYVGKRMTRQIKCDVFASTRDSFMMPDGHSHPVVLEFYFASDDYSFMPDKADNITSKVPVMMVVTANDSDSILRINIVDFNEKQHEYSIFDVSSCYGATAKMHIRILMDGQYVESTKEAIIGEGKLMIADLMKISINRVQNVHMSHDATSIALYASILGRAYPEAHFTYVSSEKRKVDGDAKFPGVGFMNDCATKCLQSKDFVCNSFDVCGNDCILSKGHIASKATYGTTWCHHYSRTVDGPQIEELSLKSAWYNLLSGIDQGSFLLDIPNDTGDTTYKGISLRLENGVINVISDTPQLKDTMTYKEEIVAPGDRDVRPTSVYYDRLKNLTRIDTWDVDRCLFCDGPAEIVQDFKLGVSYVINKVTGECHPEHMPDKSFDTIKSDPSKHQLLKEKDPMGLFFLDSSYYFIGQKDVRGMLTDVFESWRTDYNVTKEAVFRYYFLSNSWQSVSSSVPVKLEIVSDTDNYNTVFNFFEFVEQPVPMSIFDVTECFREDNKIIDFLITFDGVYDQQPANFILAVVDVIKDYTKIGDIRIQKPEISYDNKHTYFQASLLETPPSISLFKSLPRSATVTKPQNVLRNIDSAEVCADKCVSDTAMNCNAFQYCFITKRCELHSHHFGDSHSKDSATCSFYTRIEDAPTSDPTTAHQVMTDIINLSRKKQFKIKFTTDKRTYSFTAKSVLTDIDRDNSKSIASVQNMESYSNTYKKAVLLKYSSLIEGLSIDDCAYKCTQSQSINCESFSYCFLKGQCILSEEHPTNSTMEHTDWCDIYERTYLSLFEELPGRTFPMEGESQSAGVQGPDSCARQCINAGVEKCQSFQYCKDLNACAFSKRHTMDVPAKEIQTSSIKCSAYSIIFLKDFKKASTKVENLVDNVLIKNVSVKQCAQICLRDQGPNCASFDYCPSDHICRITGVDEIKGGKVSGPTKLNCSHYTRTDMKAPPRALGQKQANKGNKGSAVGLGIGMFILGTILGLLLIYFIHQKGSFSKVDDMKVNFLKLENQ